MATIEESFLYPLILLLVGAGVSGVLVSWITNRWQDRRTKQQNELEDRRKDREIEVEHKKKELEIKVDIASKMVEVMAFQLSIAVAAVARRKKSFAEDEQAAHDENMRVWDVDVNIVSSKLETYFPGTGVKERWMKYCRKLYGFSGVSRQYFYETPTEEQKAALRINLEGIRKYLSSTGDDEQTDWVHLVTDMTFDLELWLKMRSAIAQRGDEIIKDVLKLPIKVF